MSQKLFIGTSGSITSLRVATDKGIQVSGISKVDVQRVSEIIWDNDEQKWYISFLSGGRLRGKVTSDIYDILGQMIGRVTKTILFDSYEGAVAEEVKLINALRRKFGSTVI